MQNALIFDMDGTMVDNMMVHHHAWQKKLAELGKVMTLEEVIATCHGKNDEILQRIFGEQYSFEERDKISFEKEAIYREVFLPELRLVDGLAQLLQTAHEAGIPMGIGTAARAENVDFVLDNLNIRHYFKSIVCDRDVTLGKPDPTVFFKVADQLDVPYEQCLVFEDSPTGARTALNAGMKAVIITTTHKAEEFEGFASVLFCLPDYTTLNLFSTLKRI